MQQGAKAYSVGVAAPDQELDEAISLPDSLRKVLGSWQKLQILCEIEAGIDESKDLADRLTSIQRKSINLHLNELEQMGWITVGGLRKYRGSHASVWQLSEQFEGFSWRQLVTQLRSEIPAPSPLADSVAPHS